MDPRMVVLPDRTVDLVDKFAYLGMRRDNNPALFVTYGDTPKRLRRGDIPRLMQPLARQAGIQNI